MREKCRNVASEIELRNRQLEDNVDDLIELVELPRRNPQRFFHVTAGPASGVFRFSVKCRPNFTEISPVSRCIFDNGPQKVETGQEIVRVEFQLCRPSANPRR